MLAVSFAMDFPDHVASLTGVEMESVRANTAPWGTYPGVKFSTAKQSAPTIDAARELLDQVQSGSIYRIAQAFDSNQPSAAPVECFVVMRRAPVHRLVCSGDRFGIVDPSPVS
jgi:hypothetical protein